MFQSRSLRSSPGVYLRCSLNSTEKPWNGLACKPWRKPSTMNLARKSSRATWRMTSGRRYFSGAATSLLFLLVLRYFGVGDDFEQLFDHILARFSFGLGLEVGADAMAQHRDGALLDVVDGHAETAVHGGDGP